MLKDKEGNLLFRKVIVKIVFPDEIFPPKVITQHAPPRQGFGSNGVEDLLMKIADQLDTLHPYWEFKLVPLAPEGRTARYVLTFSGYRRGKIQPPKEAPPLEPGTAGSMPLIDGYADATIQQPPSQE